MVEVGTLCRSIVPRQLPDVRNVAACPLVVSVAVFGRSAGRCGRVTCSAFGSLNADGMPLVMSGREDVRPVVVVSGAAVMVSAVERMPFSVVAAMNRHAHGLTWCCNASGPELWRT